MVNSHHRYTLDCYHLFYLDNYVCAFFKHRHERFSGRKNSNIRFYPGPKLQFCNICLDLCNRVGIKFWRQSYYKFRIRQFKKKPNLNQFPDWGTAIDISAFYGYSQELTQLQSWILQDGCRLLGLFGIGGVGKTTLATQLAKQIHDQFNYVFWRSVPTVPCFDSMMTDLLSLFSHHKENKLNINRIIYYLRTHRCLIILDHVDIDHLKYMQFIKIIAETHHQSCVIFTCREQHQEFTFLEYWLSSVRCLKLSNSSEIALSLIESQPLRGTDQEKHDLCNFCNNNPLKVKQMIVSIIHLYNGDIGKFLAENTS